MSGFDYRAEQQAKRQRASTGVFRSSATGQTQESFTHQLVGSGGCRFHGGTPSNALSRAAWAHNGKAPGSKPR
jgi:hypothetical protein